MNKKKKPGILEPYIKIQKYTWSGCDPENGEQTISYKNWKNLYCSPTRRYQLDNVPTALEIIFQEAYFLGRRFIYITGVSKDKEYKKIASIMVSPAKSVHTIPLPDITHTLLAVELFM